MRSLGVGVIAHGNQSPTLDVPAGPSDPMDPKVSGANGAASSGFGSSASGSEPDGAEPNGSAYDLDRLERAISALVDENVRLRGEAARLRQGLDEKGERIRTLEVQVREANQRRQDVIKRVDELIAQMDALDAQLAQAEPNPS